MPTHNAGALAGVVLAVLLALIGGGATMTGYVNPPLGWTLVAIGALGAVLILVWTFWPGISERVRWRRHLPLQLVPEVIRLKVPDRHLGDAQLLRAARNQPHFAVVKVRNDGKRDLASVVPQVGAEGCEAEKCGAKKCGAWWQASEFDSIGEGIPLNVGVERFLVLAVRYHYPEAPQRDARRDHEWYPVTAGRRDYADMVAVKAAISPLGEHVGFEVRFRAEGVDQTDHFEALTNDAGDPVFRRTAVP